MAKYALFAGDCYYPAGGWEDFVMAGTLDECKGWDGLANPENRYCELWAHIVDLEARQIVLEFLRRPDLPAGAWVDYEAPDVTDT